MTMNNENSASAIVQSDGLSFVMHGCADDPITKHHIKTGSFYELSPMKRLVSLINRFIHEFGNGYIIDAGANIGNHTLYFAGTCPDTKVFSFEMNPITFRFLEVNVELAALDNVSIYNYGLSSKDGRCGVKENIGNPLGGTQLDFSNGACNVELIAIDQWARKFAPQTRCALIKLDVEGHEFEVLKGAKELIQQTRPMIYAELKEVQQFKEISEFLQDLGYTVAYAEDGALPNFLFVQRSETNVLFSVSELDQIKQKLCARVVDAWQLHRKIKRLSSQ